MLAISSGRISLPSSDVGRSCSMNRRSASANGTSEPTRSRTNSSTPGVSVGPGMTALTVTPEPFTSCAMPREIEICAVFVMP